MSHSGVKQNNGATHMPAISGMRRRPWIEFIHYMVAQRRESPDAGSLTPLPAGEFTPSLLPGNFRGYLLRRFFYRALDYSRVWQLRGTHLCRLSPRGSRLRCIPRIPLKTIGHFPRFLNFNHLFLKSQSVNHWYPHVLHFN